MKDIVCLWRNFPRESVKSWTARIAMRSLNCWLRLSPTFHDDTRSTALVHRLTHFSSPNFYFNPSHNHKGMSYNTFLNEIDDNYTHIVAIPSPSPFTNGQNVGERTPNKPQQSQSTHRVLPETRASVTYHQYYHCCYDGHRSPHSSDSSASP